jgi:hypothetical protein
MEETTQIGQSTEMLYIALQAIMVLLAGFILWRVMIVFNKKKSKPKKSSYFSAELSNRWKGRR